MTGPFGAETATEAFEAHALDALRWNWGEVYEIAVEGGQWRAWRLDRIGGAIDAAGPEELRKAILDDYATRPVRRSHEIVPAVDSAYIIGPEWAGRQADLRDARHYPVEAVCSGCGGRIVCLRLLSGPDGEWRHEERP